jgi:hypothetical protein
VEAVQGLLPELESSAANGLMTAFAGALRSQLKPDAAKRDYAFNATMLAAEQHQ